MVLVGGLTVPCPIWHELVPVLSKHFHILLYGELIYHHSRYVFDYTILPDHYGRGYSQAPEANYDATFYASTLALLLQYVGWSKTYVVGTSMVCGSLTCRKKPMILTITRSGRRHRRSISYHLPSSRFEQSRIYCPRGTTS